jgi:thiamine-monophosphate kinase
MALNEFDIIRTYFAPLSVSAPEAFQLTDDAALLNIPDNQTLVCTKDALTEGVHFFPGEDSYRLAQKLLGVNLSDLAAMGASPLAYLLALHLPQNTTAQWFEGFSHGFKDYTAQYGGTLIGGDTTTYSGPLCLSLTALGTVPKGQALLRQGAKPGDSIYVSGTIGDSHAGLRYIKDTLTELPKLSASQSEYITQRYHIHTPRLALGTALLGVATSCIDISDGLLADLGHLCNCSKTGAIIYPHLVPLSEAALASHIPMLELMGGGDDYELLFTIPQKNETILQQIAPPHIPLTKIGQMTDTAPPHIMLVDAQGKKITLPNKKGYLHQAGL